MERASDVTATAKRGAPGRETPFPRPAEVRPADSWWCHRQTPRDTGRTQMDNNEDREGRPGLRHRFRSVLKKRGDSSQGGRG